MEYPDHKYPDDTTSYPPQSDVLKFIHSYADRFDLNRYIKLSHLVISVKPIDDGEKWEIIVKDLLNTTFETTVYDAVMVCNGHYFKPKIPHFDGANSFVGEIIHSHNYRTARAYCGIGTKLELSRRMCSVNDFFFLISGKSVLVVGGGPSGIDLVLHLSRTASRITFSQHKRSGESKESFEQRQGLLPENVTLQENVKRLVTNGAEFIDGSIQTFEVIFFATGKNFEFHDK